MIDVVGTMEKQNIKIKTIQGAATLRRNTASCTSVQSPRQFFHFFKLFQIFGVFFVGVHDLQRVVTDVPALGHNLPAHCFAFGAVIEWERF